MNTFDPRDEEAWISRARAALSPSAGDQLRVRHAVSAALSAGGVGAEARVQDNAPAATMGAASGKLAMAVLAAAALGGGGYVLGYRAGLRAPRPMAAAAAVTEGLATTTPPPASSRGEEMPAAEMAADPRGAPVAPGREPRRHGKVTRATSPSLTASPAAPSPPASAATLAEEVRALRAIERALRDERPHLALALLQQLGRDVPHGKLQEERDATYATARCLAGERPLGLDLVREFAEAHPQSVYLARVRQSCAAPAPDGEPAK